MSKPKLQILVDGYRLVLPPDPAKTNAKGERSEVHDFGETLDYVAADGKRYIGGVTLPEGQEEGTETESILDHWLYVATPVDVDVEDLEEESPKVPVVSAKAELEKILRSAEMAPQDTGTTSTKPATKPATITKETAQ